jgi:hypothetical protein
MEDLKSPLKREEQMEDLKSPFLSRSFSEEI